jgi:hypothetical protein
MKPYLPVTYANETKEKESQRGFELGSVILIRSEGKMKLFPGGMNLEI